MNPHMSLFSSVARAAVVIAVLNGGDTLADDLPNAPFNGANWTAHLDHPVGTVPNDFISDRFYERDYTDGVNEPSQHHHLLFQIHNLANGTNPVKVKFKVKRPGGLEKNKDTGTYLIPALQSIILTPIKFDERDLLKKSSDTGKLRLKVRWGNNVNQVEFGVAIVEDPPCVEHVCGSNPECCGSTVMEDPEPPDPDNYIEVSLEDAEPVAVPAMPAPALLLLGGLVLISGWMMVRRRIRSSVW